MHGVQASSRSWLLRERSIETWNAEDLGSGGEPDVFRRLEGWNWRNGRPANLSIMGSMVVMNTQRSSHALNADGDTAIWSHTRVHGPANMLLEFNTDLLSAGGQPPFSPSGVQSTRVIATVSPDG